MEFVNSYKIYRRVFSEIENKSIFKIETDSVKIDRSLKHSLERFKKNNTIIVLKFILKLVKLL